MKVFERMFKLKAIGMCPRCECVVDTTKLRDELSKKEFEITGYCQDCQDAVFE